MNNVRSFAGICAGTILLAGAIEPRAAVSLVGVAQIAGNGIDSSGLGSGKLEDGVSPKNGLNGFGSGLAWAGGNTFYALSDRGPNKVAYTGGTAVDNTTSYPCRFQKFEITLDTTGPRANGVFASYAVNATLKGTTLFKTAKGDNYIGISTAFAHDQTENLRLDPEGLRVAPDGSFWVSDEYGPWILHFDAKGNQIGSLAAPAGFRVAKEDSTGAKEDAANTVGRTSNKGAEGLALTPDGNTLAVMMQSPLLQDSSTNGLFNRLMVYDLAHPGQAARQYVYPLDNNGLTVSEIVAVNNHQFLVDERNGKGGKKGVKLLYLIDIAQDTLPTDLSATSYDGATKERGLPGAVLPAGIVPLRKKLLADVGKILLAATPWPFSNASGVDSLPDKIEGYAFGPDLPDGRHLLLVTNDNDYVTPDKAAGSGYPDYVFALAVDTADLRGFELPRFDGPTTGIRPAAGRKPGFDASLRGGNLAIASDVAGDVRLEILGADGRSVMDLGNRTLVAGTRSIALPAPMGSGLHILRCSGAVTASRVLIRP